MKSVFAAGAPWPPRLRTQQVLHTCPVTEEEEGHLTTHFSLHEEDTGDTAFPSPSASAVRGRGCGGGGCRKAGGKQLLLLEILATHAHPSRRIQFGLKDRMS